MQFRRYDRGQTNIHTDTGTIVTILRCGAASLVGRSNNIAVHFVFFSRGQIISSRHESSKRHLLVRDRYTAIIFTQRRADQTPGRRRQLSSVPETVFDRLRVFDEQNIIAA